MKRAMPEIIALGAYDASLVYRNATETKPRRVHLYEIEEVTEDGGTSWIDGRAYPIRAHHIIIGKPGRMRHTELPFKCRYLHLMVEDEGLAALLEALPEVYLPADPTALAQSMHHLIAAYTAPDADGGMSVAAALCGYLAALIRDARLTGGTRRETEDSPRIIERAIAFMDAHDCQNLTLCEIADHVHLSRIYFHNLFVTATGRTPHRYLLERRIWHARRLLMTTEMPLSEIAQHCGFSSQSYFNQVFRREVGCTPRAYQKEMSLRY